MINFGPWRPDQPQTEASRNILNAHVRRTANGVSYYPAASLLTITGADALPERPRGAAYGMKADGSYTIFVCTSDTIYTVSALGILTQIGTGYALPSGDNWSLVQFGKYMLFTNKVDGVLAYDIDVGGSISAVSAAPAARHLFVWSNCVFALDCDGDAKLMRNSDFNDHTDWSGGVADYQVFDDGGPLMWGGATGETGALVLQKTKAHVLYASGTTTLYAKRQIEGVVGCVNPSAAATANGMALFVDETGIWLYADGLRDIGQEKVNEYFSKSMINGGGYPSVSVAVDQRHRRFVIRFKGIDTYSDDVFDDLLAYYWDAGEFVPFEDQTSYICDLAVPATLADDLNVLADSLDALVDDPLWSGGRPRLAAFDADFKLGYFVGPNLAATLETPDVSLDQSQLVTRVSINADAPLQSSDATVQIGARKNRNGAVSWGTAQQIGASGRAPARARGKVIRARLNFASAASWSEATGVEFPKTSSGGYK